MQEFINVDSIDEFACEVQDYWDLHKEYDIDRVKLAAAGTILGSVLKFADQNDAAVLVRPADENGDMTIRVRGDYLSAQGDERGYLRSAVADADLISISIDLSAEPNPMPSIDFLINRLFIK